MNHDIRTSEGYFLLTVLSMVWAYTIGDIWRNRHSPGATQALAGVLALGLSQVLLLSDLPTEPYILGVFIAGCLTSVGLSLAKVVRYARASAISRSLKYAYFRTMGLISIAGGSSMAVKALLQ